MAKPIRPMDFSRLIFERCCDIGLKNQLKEAGYTPAETGPQAVYALSIQILAIMLDLQAKTGTESWIMLDIIAGKLSETEHINHLLSPGKVKEITKKILASVLQNQGRPFKAVFLGKNLTVEQSKPVPDSDGILVKSKPDGSTAYKLTDSAYRFMYANDEILIKQVLTLDVMAWLGEKAIKDNDFVQANNILAKTQQMLNSQKSAVNEDIKRIKDDIMGYSLIDEQDRVDALQKQLKDYEVRLEKIKQSATSASISVQNGNTSINDEQKEALSQIMKRLRTMLMEKVQAYTSVCRLQRIYAQELGTLRIDIEPRFSYSKNIYEQILNGDWTLEKFADEYLPQLLIGRIGKAQKQATIQQVLAEPLPAQDKNTKTPIKLKTQEEIEKQQNSERKAAEERRKEKINKYMASIEALVKLLSDKKKHRLSELAETSIASDTWPLIYQSLVDMLRVDTLQLPSEPGAYFVEDDPQIYNMLAAKIIEITGQKLKLNRQRCPINDQFCLVKDKMTDMWLWLGEEGDKK